MTPVRHASPSSRASSSGTHWDNRDPAAPPLTRMRHYEGVRLDLIWANGHDSGRPTACPTLDGCQFAPPPIGPMDKGKKPLRPLCGDHNFRWGYDAGGVYALEIQQSAGGGWDRYYCDPAQPRNATHWVKTYKHFSQALRGDVTPPRSRPEARPALPALPAPGSTRRSEAAPAPAPVVAKAGGLGYTAEEAERQLKKLRDLLDEADSLMWGTYREKDLLAVIRTRRPLWLRLIYDRTCHWDYAVCHRPLHDAWSYHDAHIVGGKVAPRRHGENVMLEADESDWLLELSISEKGQPQTRINGQRAHIVTGMGQCALAWKC